MVGNRRAVPRWCAHGTGRAASFQAVAVLVTTPVFEGPFDVLLQLVLDHKVDVCDVPIAPVVDAFLGAHRRGTADGPGGGVGVPGHRALCWSSSSRRRLLPGPDEVDSDEEFVGLEQRDLLLARLVELQAYSAAAHRLQTPHRAGCALAASHRRARRAVHRPRAGPARRRQARQTSPAAFRRATVARPQPLVDLSHVTVEQVSVCRGGGGARGLSCREAARSPSGELTSHLKTRMQVIVRFLALLELHKRGVAHRSTRVRPSATCTSGGSNRSPVLVMAGAPEERTRRSRRRSRAPTSTTGDVTAC